MTIALDSVLQGLLLKIDAFHYIQLGTVYRCVTFG